VHALPVRADDGLLTLMTIRSHDQYNTTIYGLDDRYRGVKGGRRVVFVNPADIAALGLTDGASVDLISEYRNAAGDLEERRAKDFVVVAYSTPTGNAAAYYPETNPLVPLDHTALKSNTPVSKAIVIRLEAAHG
jgi:anaerobic selenocysteine-containing dehydrogenase